jgi:hypothetical protein
MHAISLASSQVRAVIESPFSPSLHSRQSGFEIEAQGRLVRGFQERCFTDAEGAEYGHFHTGLLSQSFFGGYNFHWFSPGVRRANLKCIFPGVTVLAGARISRYCGGSDR